MHSTLLCSAHIPNEGQRSSIWLLIKPLRASVNRICDSRLILKVIDNNQYPHSNDFLIGQRIAHLGSPLSFHRNNDDECDT